jgi:hypothetical protein
MPVAGVEANAPDGTSAQIERLNAGLAKIIDGFSTEEFAADFVVCLALLLE